MAHGADAVPFRELRDHVRHARQHVHVLMTVQVADWQTGGSRAADLRVELGAYLCKLDLALEIAPPEGNRMRQETPVRAD